MNQQQQNHRLRTDSSLSILSAPNLHPKVVVLLFDDLLLIVDSIVWEVLCLTPCFIIEYFVSSSVAVILMGQRELVDLL